MASASSEAIDIAGAQNAPSAHEHAMIAGANSHQRSSSTGNSARQIPAPTRPARSGRSRPAARGNSPPAPTRDRSHEGRLHVRETRSAEPDRADRGGAEAEVVQAQR